MPYNFPVKPPASSGSTLSAASVAQYAAAKRPVHTIATANVSSLSGLSGVINGHTVANGDRILLTAQSTGSQNGVYVAASGAWARAEDFTSTTDASAVNGAVFPVASGYFAGSHYRCTNTSAITFGSTTPTFAPFGACLYARTLALSEVQVAATSLDTPLFDVPAGGALTDLIVRVRTAAAYGANLTVNAGWTGVAYDDLLNGLSIKNPTEERALSTIPDSSSDRGIVVRIIGTGSNLTTVVGLDDGIEISAGFTGAV